MVIYVLLANVNNIRSNTKGLNINVERLAESVIAIEEKQEQSAQSIEMIHTLVIKNRDFLVFILPLFPIIFFIASESNLPIYHGDRFI